MNHSDAYLPTYNNTILANIQLLVLIETAAKTVTLIGMNSVSDIDCINPLNDNNISPSSGQG